MSKQKIDFKWHSIEPGFVRVYLQRDDGKDPQTLYCLQPGADGAPELLICTPEGEPEYPIHPDRIGSIDLPSTDEDFVQDMAAWLTANRDALNISCVKRSDESHQGSVSALDALLYNCRPGCRAPDWATFNSVEIWPSRHVIDSASHERRVLPCNVEQADFFTVYGSRPDNGMEPITDCASSADAEAVRALFLAHFVE